MLFFFDDSVSKLNLRLSFWVHLTYTGIFWKKTWTNKNKIVKSAFFWMNLYSFDEKLLNILFVLPFPMFVGQGMLCVAILFHHLACVCVLHLSCVYFATLSYCHSIFVVFTYQSPSHLFNLPRSTSFSSSTIDHTELILSWLILSDVW